MGRISSAHFSLFLDQNDLFLYDSRNVRQWYDIERISWTLLEVSKSFYGELYRQEVLIIVDCREHHRELHCVKVDRWIATCSLFVCSDLGLLFLCLEQLQFLEVYLEVFVRATINFTQEN